MRCRCSGFGSHLINQIASLQAQVGRDVFVNCPGELVVKFPGNTAHDDGTQCNNTRHGDEERVHSSPEAQVDFFVSLEFVDGIVDLIILYGRIDQHGQIERTQANNLNCVFQSQSIPHQRELIDEAEDEEGEVGGDGARLSRVPGITALEIQLESSKDISETQASVCVPRCVFSALHRTRLTLQVPRRLRPGRW